MLDYGVIIMEELIVPLTLKLVVLMKYIVELGLNHTPKCKVLSKFA